MNQVSTIVTLGLSSPVLALACYAAQPQASAGLLQARLYPMNGVANEGGVVSGTISNLMTSKGRLQLDYRGERLAGRARLSADKRRGVASAYSARGVLVSCEYQMETPYEGAGTCSMSNGARYQLHIGG